MVIPSAVKRPDRNPPPKSDASRAVARALAGLLACWLSGAPPAGAAENCLPGRATAQRDLWLIAGQSNANGLARTDNWPGLFERGSVYPGVRIFGLRGPVAGVIGRDNAGRYHDIDWAAQMRWGTAAPGYGSKDLAALRIAYGEPQLPAEALYLVHGPELPLAAALADLPPYQHYIAKHAINGSSLKRDWGPRGAAYRQFLNVVVAAINRRRHERRLRIRALYFMQGESDALRPDWAGDYLTGLADLIERLRADIAARGCLALGRDFPIVLGRIQDNPRARYRGAVRAAQREIARRHPDVLLIDTDDAELIPDRVHLSERGQTLAASRVLQALRAGP